MTVEILLLRGVNVGGHRKLPMDDLRSLLVKLGAAQVETYIQSGNAVYRNRVKAVAIADAIQVRFGFRAAVQTRSLAEWSALIEQMPFREVEDHKALHLFLLERESDMPHDDLVSAAGPEERLWRGERAIWLHTPKYLSGSRIAERMEKLLGVPTTSRNWRTVCKLREMGVSLG